MKHLESNKKIFISIGNANELAHVANEPLPSQFYNYIVGYHHAAKALIEQTLNSADEFSEYIKREKLRLCVIPACFLYRQYLELSLKDIYIRFSDDNEDAKKKKIYKVSHKLEKIWKCTKPLIEKTITEEDKEQLVTLESYVLEFAHEDPFSIKYRYPITQELTPTIPNERDINIRNMMVRMDEVEWFLAGVVSSLEVNQLQKECAQHRENALKYCDQKEYILAIEHYKKALDGKKQWSETHPDLVTGYAEIADIYFKQDDLNNASDYYLKSVDLHNKIHDNKTEAPIYLSYIYNFIGLIYKKQKKYDLAIEYYTKALENPNITDFDKNNSYSDLARVYRNMNEAFKSKQFYEMAMNIRIKLFGENSNSVIVLRNEIKKLTY